MPNPSQTAAAACLALAALAAAASCTATRPALPDVGKAAWATPSAAGEIQGDWWRAFGSRDLDQRIDAALENNADLAMLAKRIDLARAQGAALGAGSWPRAEAGGGYRAGEESTRMTGFETRDVEPWDAAGTIAWEVDFLGKWRSRRSAARRGTDAAFADAAAGRLALAAEVASSYFRALRLAEEADLVAASADSQSGIVKVLRDREAAGLADAIAVARQEAEGERLLREADELRRRAALSALRLDTLIGVPAGSGEAPRGRLRDLDVPAPPAAAPSEFLARRPDVAAAEARVRAAFDIARAAKLDLFPNLSLKLGGSLEAGALTGPAKSWIATAGPLLSIPVFDPARLAEVRQSDAEAAVAAEAYRAAALRAFEEAEGAMLSLQSRRRQAQRADATAAKLAEVRKRTGDRFAEGLVSQLEVLEDERQSLDAQRAALQSREAALADAAAVFKAMGGGFR